MASLDPSDTGHEIPSSVETMVRSSDQGNTNVLR
jgi:hypothetical protein